MGYWGPLRGVPPQPLPLPPRPQTLVVTLLTKTASLGGAAASLPLGALKGSLDTFVQEALDRDHPVAQEGLGNLQRSLPAL